MPHSVVFMKHIEWTTRRKVEMGEVPEAQTDHLRAETRETLLQRGQR